MGLVEFLRVTARAALVEVSLWCPHLPRSAGGATDRGSNSPATVQFAEDAAGKCDWVDCMKNSLYNHDVDCLCLN